MLGLEDNWNLVLLSAAFQIDINPTMPKKILKGLGGHIKTRRFFVCLFFKEDLKVDAESLCQCFHQIGKVIFPRLSPKAMALPAQDTRSFITR